MSEGPLANLLSVAEAIRIIDAAAVKPRTVQANLDDAAGRRLATSLAADRDDPPFDKSQMDGFAVRFADASAGARLHVIGEIPAGSTTERRVAAGEAMTIMTGAPLPAGADAVVPVEQTSRDGELVIVHQSPKPGQAIARRGSDCRQGDIVLRQGSKLGPAQIAVAASMGAASVRVFARPLVSVLSTGDELVPIDQVPTGPQIRNSNSAMLMALLRSLGCDARDLGIARDDPRLIRAAIESGLNNNALFVTGGMSMGERDYVPRLLVEMGFDLKVSKLRIKPGKPFLFAVRPHVGRDQFVFGLPGNPVSAFVCTLRLASRLLTRMAGGEPGNHLIPATLRTPLPPNGAREFYQPATLDAEGGVTPLTWKSSADIYTLAMADVLLVRTENEQALPAGTRVHTLKLPQF